MQQIAENEPSQRHDFEKELCNKAQGVSLWVKLVVRSLVDGVSNSDRMADLRARLELLPADLEEFYRHMMAKTEKNLLERSVTGVSAGPDSTSGAEHETQ